MRLMVCLFRSAIPLLVLVCCLALGARPSQGADTIVTDVRVGLNSGTTRFVLDLTKKVDSTVFTLADPYRIVIDLPEVGWRLPSRPLPKGIGVLHKLRYGLFSPGTTRVVLDTTGPAKIEQVFMLKPSGAHGYRIVLDVVSDSRAAFIKNLKRPPVRVAFTPQAPSKSASVAQPKAEQAALRMPLQKPKKSTKKKVIALDPGHGGIDPGTVGRRGVYEKHITLAMARELKKQLEKSGKYKVVLTRQRDVFIRLRDRVARARKAGADLFISIHADSIKNKKIRGLSVYTLSEKASDKEAAALAEKENKVDLLAGMDLSAETPEVTNILIDLAQRESMNQSVRFASSLVKELQHETKLLRNTHRFAGFAVLKAPDIPSVLLEMGFLSNRQDEKALRDKKYRSRLSAAAVRAMDAFFARIEEANRL
jgi:N-acetylmuramoyl-L-alanine amidase